MGKLDNIKPSVFKKFLKQQGLQLKEINGDHEIWVKAGMTRPVVLQTKTDPVPRIHINTNLDSMQTGESVLLEFLQNKKQRRSKKKDNSPEDNPES